MSSGLSPTSRSMLIVWGVTTGRYLGPTTKNKTKHIYRERGNYFAFAENML